MPNANPNKTVLSAKCERCGAPIEPIPDYPKICDDCYSVYGSCCNEWEDNGDNPPDP